MFKNASILKITLPQPMLTQTLEDALKANEFAPCGPTQTKSAGWTPPRGNPHGALAELVAGQIIVRLMIESKSVPTSAVRSVVDDAVKGIEKMTGRKPGKKERRQLTDDTVLALLPNAFPRQTAVTAWIDSVAGRLVVDSASQSAVDELVTALVHAIPGAIVAYLQTSTTPSSFMTAAVHHGEFDQPEFSIGRACMLEACDESRARVRYQRCSLDTDDVRQHIVAGKVVRSLGMNWADRVSFTLDDFGVLRGVEFDDVVFEGGNDTDADGFDSDVAIMTGEFGMLIPELIAAMGGELAQEGDDAHA